jgi:hypothetical protein
MFIITPGPPIDMLGVFVTSKPDLVEPLFPLVQVAVDAVPPFELDVDVPAMPLMPAMAVPVDSGGATG